MDEVRVSKADELEIVNTSVTRRDAIDKIRGTALYTADSNMEGVLHARLVRSPVPSAYITKRDVSEAEELPGVVSVFLGEDVPNNEFFMNVPGQSTGTKALITSFQVLAIDRVRYHGEPVALIVAEDEDVLAEAVEAAQVGIYYEEAPVVSDPEAALADDAPSVHGGGNLVAHWEIEAGDIDSAFAAADVVVEGEYQTQFVDPAYLETETGLAWMGDNDVIVIRSSTQAVEHFRDVAEILGLPSSKVRVIAPYVGGGFGGKETMTIEPYLGLCVHKLRRPVHMRWTRAESLLARSKRHPVKMRYRTAAKSDGMLLGHEVDIVSDAGAYGGLSSLVLFYCSVTAGGPYKTDNIRLKARAASTNNPPASAMRGFGAMQTVFGYESQMDRVARALGLDPVAVRKQNALSQGDQLPVGQELQTEVLVRETVDAVLEAAGRKPEPSSDDIRVGRGLASNIQPYGRCVWLGDSSSAWVGLEHDGSARVRIAVPDIGGGQSSTMIQVAAEVLGLDYNDVAIHFGDSALTPLGGTSTASRQTYMSGSAVQQAASVLRSRIAKVVAEESGQPVRSLRFSCGVIEGPDSSLAMKEAVQLALKKGVSLSALETFYAPRVEPEGGSRLSGRAFPDYTFGTHLVDVEVDTGTGIVELLQYIVSHDVGRAINPQSVMGQMRGGAAMGIGSALLEEVVVDEGVNLTGGFFKYLLPTAKEIPAIHCVVIESGQGLGPFGARGIGEAPTGPPAAAIASAIENAVGARPTRLPMTPERVLDCVDRGARTSDWPVN